MTGTRPFKFPIRSRRGLGSLLNSLNLRCTGVEIGVQEGFFSRHILETSELQKLYSVDIWNNNDIYIKAQQTLRKFEKRSVLVKKYSIEASRDFPDEFFDFIYIDAEHRYEYVSSDIESWWPKLKSGGLFSGHDYENHNDNKSETWVNGVFGVVRAVNEFCAKKNIRLYLTTDDNYNSWYFLKRSITHL